MATTGERFERAVSIMARLRGPGGCPWDREQTFDTIRPYTLEEAYEVVDAIERGGAGKPAPDVFLAAAAAEPVVPAHCIVIEDSVHGVTAARAAGMDCLGLAPRGDGAALRAAGAIPFRSMHDLPGLLRLVPR